MNYPAYDESKRLSEKRLNELRTALHAIVPSDVIAITCGSYARREASEASDLDFYVVQPDGLASPDWLGRAREEIERIVPKAPASGGAFGTSITRTELSTNIGGSLDSNESITRRMLYLLEGEWLTNEVSFRDIRRGIIEKYLREGHGDHSLAQFLLNDIIRYWRTMTVDYEFKTTENGKPWAVRNVKLSFSRKLVYASGLFSVADTQDRSRESKRRRLEDLFDLPPLDRIDHICGAQAAAPIRESYEHFLRTLNDSEKRNHLETLVPGDRQDPLFREMKNESYHFTRALLQCMEKTFHSTHTIWRAVLF